MFFCLSLFTRRSSTTRRRSPLMKGLGGLHAARQSLCRIERLVSISFRITSTRASRRLPLLWQSIIHQTRFEASCVGSGILRCT